MEHPNLTIDMGYRGEFNLTVKFTDQNNVEHVREFKFQVFGEKPTYFQVVASEKEQGKIARLIYLAEEPA